MARELKSIICKHLERTLSSVDSCVLIDYRGLDSEQTQDLRVSLRKSGVVMSVLHNRLARRIFKDRGAPAEFEQLLRGPTAILHGLDGALGASKTVTQWRKKNKDLAPFKGGLLQGKALTPKDVEKLATIPDLGTLRSTTASLFLSPLASLATAAQSLLSHFPGAVAAQREILEKSQGGGGE